MNSKINTYFIICLILFSLIPVQAVAPTKYYEIDSDIELRGSIFVNVDPTGFYASLNNGVIQIDSNNHFNNVMVRFKGIALNARLKKYNGFNVGYTHITDNEITTHEVKPLEIDLQGFAYLTTDFSTVIINGMTGTTTTTYTSQSGNHSFSVPNGSSYDLNITNNQVGVWESSDGKTYQNKSVITINGSMVTTESGVPLQWFGNLAGVNGSGDIGVGFNNESGTIQAISREVEWVWDDDNVSLHYPFDTVSGVDSEFLVLWGADNNTEPAADSTYGSEAVWGAHDAVYLLNTAPSGTIYDSTSSDYDGTGTGTLSDSDYGKDVSFVGASSQEITCGRISEIESVSKYSIRVRLAQDALDVYNGILGKGDGTTTGNGMSIYTYTDGNMYIHPASTGSASANGNFDYSAYLSAGVYSTMDIVFDGTGVANADRLKVYIDGSQVSLAFTGTIPATSGSSTSDFMIGREIYAATSYYLDGDFDFVSVIAAANTENEHITTHKNVNNPTASGIKPFYLLIGETQTTSGTANITASITGDSNTQSYNTSQSREFTLTPTGTTNNVNINTTSTDYDVTITTYWTEDTTLQTETDGNGYANQSINYTSSDYNVSADLSTTYTFDFSAQDYIGIANSTLNGVFKPTTRDGQDVNASVGELIAGVSNWWNVTVLYNNIPTLSNQSDQAAYLGVSKPFTDSSYNDPDSNPIASRLWQFGDGTNSSSSNPSHTYTSLGVLNANYTVTEDATTDSQSITKEFNVTVGVQPVQNLTSQVEQTYINFNWSDYESADYWNVSELEESAPYFNTTIILDGNKDAIYDTNSHAFAMHSPNPTTNLDYELVYWFRNSTHLIGWATGYDDDNLNNDDYFLIGIDGENDNLTANDRKFILSESGTVTAKRWGGSSWLPTSTNAEGAVVGGGVAGVITYEMIIPISEMVGFVDDATIKFFMERECSFLTPTVETFYPLNLINSTDATIWATAVLTDGEVYNYIGNTSTSEFNSTGLDIYSWYKHCFVAINGTTESTPVYSYNITAGAQHYSVSGYTKDSLGNIVAGVTVWAQNGHVMEATQSDINGFWEGVQFHYGNYTAYGNKSGYAESYIDIIVTGNLTNQNITLTAFEMTDWMLWEKLLEIEDAIDDLSTDFTPTEGNYEMLSSTYNIFLLLLGACFILAFPKRGEVTERDTGLNNVLFSFLGTILAVFLAQIIVSGQVVESFAFESQIYDPLQHYFLYLIAVIMFVVFVLNVVYYIRQRID